MSDGVKRLQIIGTCVENNTRNNRPELVHTDIEGTEWVYEEQTSNQGGHMTALVKKKDSWYWRKD